MDLFATPRPAGRYDFPFHGSFDSGDDRTVHFIYDSWPDRDKRFFRARIKDNPNDRICVKFVHRYGAEAHRSLMDLGLAPNLRAVVDLPDDWKMVVMDDISAEYERLPPSPDYLFGEQVQQALSRLHAEGYVHGDVRDVNIMVKKARYSEKEFQVMLVDFDWAGKEGETRYPSNLNRETVRGPEGAENGNLIKFEHDWKMLRFIFKALDIEQLADEVEC